MFWALVLSHTVEAFESGQPSKLLGRPCCVHALNILEYISCNIIEAHA
jgi:hypothetical protein